jgi:hypothetical protein
VGCSCVPPVIKPSTVVQPTAGLVCVLSVRFNLFPIFDSALLAYAHGQWSCLCCNWICSFSVDEIQGRPLVWSEGLKADAPCPSGQGPPPCRCSWRARPELNRVSHHWSSSVSLFCQNHLSGFVFLCIR